MYCKVLPTAKSTVSMALFFPQASALSKDLQVRVDTLLESKAEMERSYEQQLATERDEKENIERENNELKFSLEISKNENKSLKLKVSELTTQSLSLTTELNATKVKY